MNDEPEIKDRQRHSRGGCLLALLVMALVYVLSPPLVEVAIETSPFAGGNALWDVFEVVYLPLIWLYDNVKPVEDFYDWYSTLIYDLL